MLFSYIYYHQKVLITEELIKDYVQALLKLDMINSYSDFLSLDEASLLSLAKEQGNRKPFPKYGNISLTQLANSIKNRTLPKRCLEISQSIVQNIVVDEPGKKEELERIIKISEEKVKKGETILGIVVIIIYRVTLCVYILK